MANPVTRREFVTTASAATAALAASRWAAAQTVAPSGKIRMATIGCGGMGGAHVDHLLQIPEVDIVALADVDDGRANGTADKVAKARGARPQTFRDFRKLLDLKEVDAVTIATPDHWHAIAMISACQAGKDVYCEKPISHDIAEGRAMVTAAEKAKRVVQIGTQQRSSAGFRKAIDLVRSGAIGRIVETLTWNCDNSPGNGRPPDEEPPKEVDYDRWLGPAPKRPFNKNRFHYHWRWFFDYGGGMMCDWNVHSQDIVHVAMDAWSPVSVDMFGQIVRDDNRDTPDTIKAVYEFDVPQGRFTQTYILRRTNAFSPDGNPKHAGHGILFYGEKGTLFVNRSGWELTPEKDQGAPQSGPVETPLLPHFQNFLECVKSRAKTTSDIASMHQTTAACHLGNISWRVGRRIHWDGKAEKCFRDAALTMPDEDANRLLAREYRAGYELPKV